MNFETVPVELEKRAYDIRIGYGILDQTAGWTREVFPKCQHVVLIYDHAVSSFADRVATSFEKLQFRCTRIEVASGESSKSIDQAAQLWEALLDAHTDRGSLVVAVGGGVIGDLAGFVAATFVRGLPLIQLPTTLLSHVDSSVGGKTGINLPGAKNIVGAFWQPSLVVIDTQTLNTLPNREFVSGLAEVVKYGVILLPALFEYLEQHQQEILAKDPAAIRHIVKESCRAKALVVRDDERETSGLRAILNYGHTFAHAIESHAGYGKYLHGEAVSIGMQMAANLALLLGRVDEQFVSRQKALLNSLNLPTEFDDHSHDALWDIMQHDKKVEHGKLRFILPTCLGHVELVPGISKELAVAAMQAVVSE